MRTVTLPGGTKVPALGQGTWYMGDSAAKRAEEIAALQAGIDLGMTLIDTAEMYGNGRSEELVGEAIANRREKVFLVSKVLPSNASRQGTKKACERSLKRLGTDAIDLYLLHWQGNYPFEETIAGMFDLKREGKIRHCVGYESSQELRNTWILESKINFLFDYSKLWNSTKYNKTHERIYNDDNAIVRFQNFPKQGENLKKETKRRCRVIRT